MNCQMEKGTMKMSNSKLVDYTKISPNRNSPRNQDIYIITPHCVVGQVTVERLGDIFAPTSRQASSNYGIGYDGRIGMYVEEKDRSWCTSSSWNDNRAVTIEVASDTYHPYAITDEAYDSLVELMTDICKRNGKTRITWFGDKNKTLNYTPKQDEMIITVHRWFDNKACPGEYIYSRLGSIANEVNKRLKNRPEPVIGFTRIFGKNRYETSKLTANIKESVTLVSGKSYADALSAVYFAKQKKAPILLTDDAIIKDTVKYLSEQPDLKNVYIVGGEGVLSKYYEQKLKDYNVERIFGSTRYETNYELLCRCATPSKQIMIASGRDFPDAMCAGMIDRPVMLVNQTLKDRDIEFIKERGLDRFYICGGTGAVSNYIETQLSKLGETSRYFGSNRYETSRAIANTFFPKATTVIFASGKNYPDGLTASNLGNYPLILIDNNFTIEARKYISTRSINKAIVVGGPGVITDETVNWALTKLETVNK